MPAHKQVLQSIKKKKYTKAQTLPKEKVAWKCPLLWDLKHDCSKWVVVGLWSVSIFSSWLDPERKFSPWLCLASPPPPATKQKLSRVGSSSSIDTDGHEGFSGSPRDSQEWEYHGRLWSFTQKTRPLATSDQLIVLTFLKVRNEDAFFQTRTISINLWQIGISDPQYPEEELVILFVQAPQEKGNGSQHHQCH